MVFAGGSVNIRGPSMYTAGLIGLMGGFMYAYQCSAGRLMGMFPNDDEVARYKRWLQSSSHEFNLPCTLRIFPQLLWHIDDWWCKKLLSVGIVASVFGLSHKWLHIWNSSSCYHHQCLYPDRNGCIACWRAGCELFTPFCTFLILNSNPCHCFCLPICILLCVCVSLSLCGIEAGILRRGIFFLVDTHVDWNLKQATGSPHWGLWIRYQWLNLHNWKDFWVHDMTFVSFGQCSAWILMYSNREGVGHREKLLSWRAVLTRYCGLFG